jgi:hypothetical protein
MSVCFLALLAPLAHADDTAPAANDTRATDTAPPSPPPEGETSPAPPSPATAAPTTSAAEEDAMFGGGPAPEAAAAPSTSTTDLGDTQIVETTDADISSRLGLADERLTVGGKLYLRAVASFTEDTDAEDTAYSSPNLLDLFTDVRPNDRVRGFAQARLRANFTVAEGDTDSFGNELEPASVTLDQLWLKFDAAHRVYVTAGRQRIKWGSGRFWNPTDFMNQQTLDALNATVFDERTGVTLLKVHVPIEKIGANLYAVGNFDGADTVGQIGGALRTEWVLGPSELALTAAAREGDPVRLGADYSAAVGPFDLHAEAAFRHGDDGPYYEGTWDIGAFEFPDTVDRSDEWIVAVATGGEVGVKYNDEDTLYVGAEYFYNGGGYDSADLYPYLAFTGNFTPFYLGQHYLGAYAALPGPGNWDDTSFTLSHLANLSDQTHATRADVSTRINTFLSANAYAQLSYGENGEFHFSIDVDPVPGVIPDGISIPAPVASVGVGAMVNF